VLFIIFFFTIFHILSFLPPLICSTIKAWHHPRMHYIYGHINFQDPNLNGASVAPIAEVHAAALSESCKMLCVDEIQWHNLPFSFINRHINRFLRKLGQLEDTHTSSIQSYTAGFSTIWTCWTDWRPWLLKLWRKIADNY
jgi:hypothetical protein